MDRDTRYKGDNSAKLMPRPNAFFIKIPKRYFTKHVGIVLKCAQKNKSAGIDGTFVRRDGSFPTP